MVAGVVRNGSARDGGLVNGLWSGCDGWAEGKGGGEGYALANTGVCG